MSGTELLICCLTRQYLDEKSGWRKTAFIARLSGKESHITKVTFRPASAKATAMWPMFSN